MLASPPFRSPAPDYTAHSLVDNLKNVYASCGFDNACGFVS